MSSRQSGVRTKNTCLFFFVTQLITALLVYSAGTKTHPYIRFAKPQYNKFFQYLEGGQCQHVFMDIGTDTGMHIKQLYDPRHFRRAHTIRIFNEVFSAVDRKHVCTIGFEPNPLRTDQLVGLQKEYQKKGFLVSILTETALSHADGNVSLSRTMSSSTGSGVAWAAASMSPVPTNINPKTIGAALNSNKERGNLSANFSVISIDIDDFVKYLDRIWRRRHENKLFVVMDVDGAESRLLLHMHDGGSLCKVDYMMIDWHSGDTGHKHPLLIQGLQHLRNETARQRQPPQIRELELKLSAISKSSSTCRFHLIKKADYESFAMEAVHVFSFFAFISICVCFMLRKCTRKVRTDS